MTFAATRQNSKGFIKGDKGKRQRASQAKRAEAAEPLEHERRWTTDGTPLQVPLDHIVFDAKSDRLDELLDAKEIDALAQSIGSAGLLQPIQVTRFGLPEGDLDAAKYRLVFGRRRVLAARRLGWKEIHGVYVEHASEASVLEAREVENLQRQNLNPIEEAMAISNLLELEEAEINALTGGKGVIFSEVYLRETRKAAIHNIALRIAKPEQWVRDRVFLARLSGEARKAVVEGRLPLAHAREISKLADPELRDRYAEVAAANDIDRSPMDIDKLRAMVAENLYSLAQVPWKLDWAFEETPGCVECPHNSANTPDIFGSEAMFLAHPNNKGPHYVGHAKEPSAGICTMVSCFKRKAAASDQAARKAAKKAVALAEEAPKKDREKALRKAIKEHAPDHLRPESIAAVARAQIEKAQEASSRAIGTGTVKPSPAAQAKANAEAAANQAWLNATREWAKALEPAIAAALAKKPGAWSVYTLIRKSKPYEKTRNHNPTLAAKAAGAVDFLQLVNLLALDKSDLAVEHLVKIEKQCGTRLTLIEPWYDGPSGVAGLFADALNIEHDPQPSLEDFKPKETSSKKPEATVVEAPARGKSSAGTSKGRGRKGSSTAGGGDESPGPSRESMGQDDRRPGFASDEEDDG